MAEREYALGRSEEETQRLIRQGQVANSSLRRLLEDAGIGPGMRVLDLGSGAGDVALTVAEFVGEAGSVVGVDKNPAILETARERARAAGYTNVAFVVSDLDQDLDLDGEFDAVVGRRVLMYVANPVATLRAALPFLRPGGIVAVQEPVGTIPSPQERMFPPSPLFSRVVDWMDQGFIRAGAERVMGLKLYEAFLDAGLPEPQLRAHSNVFTGGDFAWLEVTLGLVRSLRPLIIQHGIATEDELDLDAIAEQLRAEFIAERKIVIGGAFFDAWARKP